VGTITEVFGKPRLSVAQAAVAAATTQSINRVQQERPGRVMQVGPVGVRPLLVQVVVVARLPWALRQALEGLQVTAARGCHPLSPDQLLFTDQAAVGAVLLVLARPEPADQVRGPAQLPTALTAPQILVVVAVADRIIPSDITAAQAVPASSSSASRPSHIPALTPARQRSRQTALTPSSSSQHRALTRHNKRK
jgi:hypothetical protein